MDDLSPASLDTYLRAKRILIDEALSASLPGEDNYPSIIFQAMRYSLFAGGKRIRPVLCLAAMETLGATDRLFRAAMPIACALEMIHTYSLIHDDLPAMDNDDCRRGHPSNHKVFGEDIAILAGDALLTEAFRLMSKEQRTVPPKRMLAVIHEIAGAAGCFGMIGGQVVDTQSEGRPMDEETLSFIHTRKTGALVLASVRSGALVAGANEEDLEALSHYGRSVGLMFQIVDDILNVEGDKKITGKSTGSDASRGKMTFPAYYGLEGSKQRVRELETRALESLVRFDERAEPLRQLAGHIRGRRS